MHPECAQVRLVDRCVRCNPGYNDDAQAYEIYRATRRGMTLAEAEKKWLADHEAQTRDWGQQAN